MRDKNRTSNKILILGLVMMIIAHPVRAQILRPNDFHLDRFTTTNTSIILGNGIVDILARDSLVWVATGFGLNKTASGGDSWKTFNSADYRAKGGISAMNYMDDSTLWIATAFDTTVSDGSELPAGGGLSYTRDSGKSWTHIPQPIDSRDSTEYKPTTTNVQNLAYDLAVLDSTIWIACFGGGLRKSQDMGQTWQVVTTDGLSFAPLSYLNHRAFSIMVENDNLWVGTAGGISKSADQGKTWRRFTHQNQKYPIAGNFVVALAYQPYTRTIWAATVETDTSELRAVSKSDNGGETWEVMLPGIFAHNFAFNDSIVYVASDQGMFVSADAGRNWYTLPPIKDFRNGEEILTNEFYSAAVSEEPPAKRVWIGSADGLAATIDNGNHWYVYRSYRSTTKPGVPAVYAYPSPFSPSRQGFIRFQYAITRAGEIEIDIYDFALDKVASIREYETNPNGTGRDRSAKWDGLSDSGKVVASGVYFFRAKIEGKVTWGKLVVIN
jgi:photosystem II stability/assembly factor-like uncharacterized protein